MIEKNLLEGRGGRAAGGANDEECVAGEMMDGLGLAETTPGPLILVTEFVGYLAANFGPTTNCQSFLSTYSFSVTVTDGLSSVNRNFSIMPTPRLSKIKA